MACPGLAFLTWEILRLRKSSVRIPLLMPGVKSSKSRAAWQKETVALRAGLPTFFVIEAPRPYFCPVARRAHAHRRRHFGSGAKDFGPFRPGGPQPSKMH